MSIRRLLTIIAVAGSLVAAAMGSSPASAITNGELDGDGHPHVVLIVADTNDGGGWRCSGTLLTPTFVLTAGHCVNAFPDVDENGDPLEVVAMRVFPASDVQAGIDAGTSHYPGPGPEAIEAASWAAHPEYENAPFWFNDVGVMLLTAPVPGVTTFGELPTVDQLDGIKKRKQTTFTAVGYGLQRINPVFIEGERVRMVSHPHLLQINSPGFTGDFSLLLSNNHSTGGTCFGDSGGPNFLGGSNVIAGVTSFGINGNCAGTGGVFRMDRQNVLDFVNHHLVD